MADLPFIITSRVVGRSTILAIAVVNGVEIASERYPIGSGKRRREIALLWSNDSRLCNGTCVLPTDIEHRLDELELLTTKAIDKRDEEMEALADAAPPELPVGTEKQRGPSHATQLVDLVLMVDGLELWHDADGNGFATIPIGEHLENWPIRANAFRRWASRLFYESLEKVPGGQALQDAITSLEGRAVHEGLEYPISVRLAFTPDAIFLDLCDENWQAVEVRSRGWQVVNNPPVKFRRPRGGNAAAKTRGRR